MRRRWLVCGIMSVLAVVAACSAADDDPEVAVPPSTAVPTTILPGVAPAQDPPPTDPPPSPGPGSAATTRPTVPDTSATTAAPGAPPSRPRPPLDDGGPLGSMGVALLSPTIPAAVVEVDTTDGVALTASARRELTAALNRYGGKRSVTTGGASTVPRSDVYRVADLRRLAAEHRASRSDGDRVAVYVLVLEGEFETSGVTGVAFAASSFAIFPDTLGGGLLSTASYAQYEASVVVHELGHLFGLVDLTGHGAFHEDPEHPGHAASRGSVMFWAVEDVTIANLFRGGPPIDFDADDRREMDLIRSGA